MRLVKDNGIRLTVNDKNLGGNLTTFPLLEKGAFVLRPEGEMEFGNLFVRELKK